MPGYFSIPNVYPQYTVGMLTPQTATTAPTVLKAQPKPGVRNISGNVTPVAPTGGGAGAFNINPPPMTGQGPYGMVPGTISYPATPYEEASRIYTGLPGLTNEVLAGVKSDINSEFTPGEMAAIHDYANTFGVGQGMPGAELWYNKALGNVVDEAWKRRQAGTQNYQSIISMLSKMGIDPALAAQIAAHNAQLNAAPDPKAAAEEMIRRYAESLNQLARGPQGGTATGGWPNMANP